MSVCLLLIDDGREDYLQRCRQSINEKFPAFDCEVLIDDTGHQLGFSGAVQEGWRQVLETGCEWVWHAESDFTYNETVDINRMIAVLKRRPYLAQMSLLRQAWNEEEKAAGGIVQLRPDNYTETVDNGDVWLEQRSFFTTNPSVYPAALCHLGWPQVRHSEGIFSAGLFANPEVRCGIWGRKWDQPRVTHIGDVRAGTGY